MQTLELIQKVEDIYDLKLLSLYEFINMFTIKLNIKKRFFYFKINKDLKYSPILKSLSYNERGLLHFEVIFEDFKKAKKTDKIVYKIAPYFSSLSRLLTLIYAQASNILGEEKTKKILKDSFNLVKRRYKEIPDLKGYIPRGILAKEEEEKTTAYSATLIDNLIKYLIATIIKKSLKLKRITTEIKEIEGIFGLI